MPRLRLEVLVALREKAGRAPVNVGVLLVEPSGENLRRGQRQTCGTRFAIDYEVRSPNLAEIDPDRDVARSDEQDGVGGVDRDRRSVLCLSVRSITFSMCSSLVSRRARSRTAIKIVPVGRRTGPVAPAEAPSARQHDVRGEARNRAASAP